MPNNNQSIDVLFNALSDQTRMAIVERLAKSDATVSELAEPFSMALPSFVQHIQVLEKSKIISTQKIGRVRVCQLRPEALSTLGNWLNDRRATMENRLDALENYLERDAHQQGKST